MNNALLTACFIFQKHFLIALINDEKFVTGDMPTSLGRVMFPASTGGSSLTHLGITLHKFYTHILEYLPSFDYKE